MAPSGRRRELLILNALLKKGLAVILCDITNVLRYGDICIEKFGHPHPMEIKSSKNTNARTSRQIGNLGKMIEYLNTDQIEGLYGNPGLTSRAALTEPQRGHADKLTPLIEQALQSGFASAEVEPGLRYIVVSGRYSKRKLHRAIRGVKRGHGDTLNQHRYSGKWASYLPFVLSFSDPIQCFEFAAGGFVIAIAFDFEQAGRIAKACGYSLSLEAPKSTHVLASTGKYWWLTSNESGEDYRRLGGHLIGRIFFEFASLEWVIQQSCRNVPDDPSGVLRKDH